MGALVLVMIMVKFMVKIMIMVVREYFKLVVQNRDALWWEFLI